MATCRLCGSPNADYEGGRCDLCASRACGGIVKGSDSTIPALLQTTLQPDPMYLALSNKLAELYPVLNDPVEQKALQFWGEAKNPRQFASLVFDKPESELTPEELSWAKSRLFAKMYRSTKPITMKDLEAATQTLTREEGEKISRHLKTYSRSS